MPFDNNAYSLKYYYEHREEIGPKKKLYRENNLDKMKKHDHDYYIENRDKIRERRRLHRLNNLELYKERKRISRLKPEIRQREKEYNLEYNKNNKTRRNKKMQDRLRNDVNFRLKVCLRSRLNKAFHAVLKIDKRQHTFEMIGCSAEELKVYIENKFTAGMSWKNYGKYINVAGKYVHGWDVDHIIPLSFAQTKDQLVRLCHYSNLQPLWHAENMKKGVKILI